MNGVYFRGVGLQAHKAPALEKQTPSGLKAQVTLSVTESASGEGPDDPHGIGDSDTIISCFETDRGRSFGEGEAT